MNNEADPPQKVDENMCPYECCKNEDASENREEVGVCGTEEECEEQGTAALISGLLFCGCCIGGCSAIAFCVHQRNRNSASSGQFGSTWVPPPPMGQAPMGQMTMEQQQVIVPDGVSAGQVMTVLSSTGQQVQVTVPSGCGPGSAMMVQVPVSQPQQFYQPGVAMPPVQSAGGQPMQPAQATIVGQPQVAQATIVAQPVAAVVAPVQGQIVQAQLVQPMETNEPKEHER